MLIELAGIDGSGKSTYVERIMRLFNAADVPCYHRSFRSTVKRLAADLAARSGHRHWRDGFNADQIEVAQAFEMVQLVYQQVVPLDLASQVIVTDSYTTAWRATAVLWGSEAAATLRQIYSVLPVPDLSIVLDVPVLEAQRRIEARPKGDHVMKIGPNSVLARYHEAFESTLQDATYPQRRIDVGGRLEDGWQAVRQAVFDRVAESGIHTQLLDATAVDIA